MRRLLFLIFALAVAVGALTSANAGCMSLLGVGNAGCGGGGGGGSYTGPGDDITYTAFYGLRAYSSATRGSKLVQVCNSTGGVDNGACGDLSSDPTTGQLVSATIGTPGITCPGANCTIKKY